MERTVTEARAKLSYARISSRKVKIVIDLIRNKPVGVAMGNACEELKAEANYITSSVDEDGVSRALEYFELI